MGLFFFRLERHIDTRGNARGTGTSPSRLSRVSRGHSPRSRSKGPRRGDHAPRQEQRRAGQRRSSEVRTPARSFKPTLAHCFFSRPTGFPRTGRALEAVRWTPSARLTRIPRRIQPRDSHSFPSSTFQRLTRPFHPVSLAGPAPYSVWCRPPAHPVRMRQRTQGAPAEGSEGALTAPGGPTAAIRARRSSTPTTSASTRGSLPPLPTLRDERDARQIKFHQPARFERSPPQRSASSSHHPAFSPPNTGTWVTAGSSARAEAPSSA